MPYRSPPTASQSRFTAPWRSGAAVPNAGMSESASVFWAAIFLIATGLGLLAAAGL